MSRELTIRKDGEAIYPIYLEEGYKKLPKILRELGLAGRRALIVTDSHIGPHYAREVGEAASSVFSAVSTMTLPPGEAQKNLDTVSQIYERLILGHFDRKDVLLALGGGVIGDMTGFAAATYLRGIRFLQLPTSLLAMVDSSIGGKTGVDFRSYKNMVGAFCQPTAVYASLPALGTLPEREFLSGFGEIVKHGLIKDWEYYEWLRENAEKLLQKDMALLEDAIFRSLQIKRQVVEADPYEKGERALLNFGHTIGHSIERQMGFSLLHGECVSLGMAAASFLSYSLGHLSKEDYEGILETLRSFSLPTSLGDEIPFDASEVLATTKSDKKMDSGRIRFVLLRSIGEAFLSMDVTDGQMLDAIASVLGDGKEEEKEDGKREGDRKRERDGDENGDRKGGARKE